MSLDFLRFSVYIQKYRTPLLLVGCGGIFSAKILFDVFPEHTFKEVVQAWELGKPAILSKKLQKVFQEVLDDTAVSSKNFRAFPAYGFNTVGAGHPWLPFGAYIGIPDNFNSSTDNVIGVIDRTMVVNGTDLEWDSDTDLGVSLTNSLVFSLQAQKFAIAREVARLRSGEPILHAAVAPICLAGACVNSVALKQIFRFQASSAIFRGAVNLLSLGLGVLSYVLASGSLSQWMDYRSDRWAAGLSNDYAKGGLEFYEKILTRNKTLRSMMGQEGKKLYAPSGNLVPGFLLQFNHASCTSRRDRILDLLKNEKIEAA